MKASFTKEDMLSFLVYNGREELAVKVVESGVPLTMIQEMLYRVCSDGNFVIAKAFIERGVSPLRKEDYALSLAAAHGNIEMMEYLVAAGCDVNETRSEAGLCAVANAHWEAASWLLENGADEKSMVDRICEYYHGCRDLFPRINISKFFVNRYGDTKMLDNYDG